MVFWVLLADDGGSGSGEVIAVPKGGKADGVRSKRGTVTWGDVEKVGSVIVEAIVA